MQARRLPDNPIITPALDSDIGTNINGPSLIRVPDWITNPLGRYYLYFAHHQGKHIRLAYADDVAGPWRVHGPGTLRLDQMPSGSHIASPDVHVDDERGELRMYFHHCGDDGQLTYLATSRDGLDFTARTTPIAPFYLRAFRWEGAWYGIAKSGNIGAVLVRSPDGVQPFEEGPHLLDHCRHTAVRVVGDVLRIVFSRAMDSPERLLQATLRLRGDWPTWPDSLTPIEELLHPAESWEGAQLPLEASRWGAVHEPVNQLRDPAFFITPERTLLVYSVAGEAGLALAELTD